MEIKNYKDFIKVLLDVGFTIGGGHDEGIFALTHGIERHTWDPETDPWEWRMRVLDERKDIAYSKVFFRKSGYITKEWYPYFLAIRRGTMDFKDEYFNGTVSQYAKRIYEVISTHDNLPFHIIKQSSGFGKEEKTKFERALVELQMKMYITMCGKQQKISQMGLEYGWASTVFCTTEKFWDDDKVFSKAGNISEQDAFDKITAQIIKLNPKADHKKISKFIKG